MQSTSKEYNALYQRIEKVEKQNRRFKQSIVFLTCCLLALILMGAKIGMRDGHFRHITAEKITIANDAGQELITIGMTGDQATGIRIFNTDGKRIIGLGISGDQKGSGILIADQTGTPRLGLGMDSDVPSLAITDKKGKKTIGIGGDENGYGLVIMDQNEVERAGIGYKAGNTGIAIYDSKGEYVRGMVQKEDGTHFSSHINTNGVEVFSGY